MLFGKKLWKLDKNKMQELQRIHSIFKFMGLTCQREMINRKILVISPDDLLYNSLRDNIKLSEVDLVLMRNDSDLQSWLKHPEKLDILINNHDNKLVREIGYFAKYAFTTQNLEIRNQIFIRKPLLLKTLIFEIKQCLSNKRLFCLLDDIIYDEIHSEIISKDKNAHKLTSKESQVLKHLLLSEDFFVSNEFLLKNVWKYSLDSDTETIKIHMNKLRSLLPKDFVKFVDNGYQLNVAKIF
jgi:hypothetical protein